MDRIEATSKDRSSIGLSRRRKSAKSSYDRDHQLRSNRHIVSRTDIDPIIKSANMIRVSALILSTLTKPPYHRVVELQLLRHATSIKPFHHGGSIRLPQCRVVELLYDC
jgi:hypothetical protein